jgi:hypothetical protein
MDDHSPSNLTDRPEVGPCHRRWTKKLPAKSRWLLVIGIFAFLGVSAWMIASSSLTPIDWSKEEEPFRSMAMPLKRVDGTIWMDGGSVSIRATDKNGKTHEFILPYDHRKPQSPYSSAYHGIFDMNEFPAKGIKMKDAERTRILAIHLIQAFGNNDKWTNVALYYLEDGDRSSARNPIRKMKKWLRIQNHF